jgi:chitinase domain-containing protein 1
MFAQGLSPRDISHITVTGSHEINATWSAQVQSSGSMLLPRVVWEAGDLSEQQQQESINQLITLVRQHSLDGLVVELPSVTRYIPWLSRLCSRLHSIPSSAPSHQHDACICVVVLRPPAFGASGSVVGGTTASEFGQVASFADRVSLMTYDFSVSHGRAGPNSPMPWVRHVVQVLLKGQEELAPKILLGLPFYGYDHGQPLVGHEFVRLLMQYRPQLQWDRSGQEHSFLYTEPAQMKATGQIQHGAEHIVYFPTLLSQSLRLNESLILGLGGVAIWEAGQGLPYFWNLL